ncbi:MAG TPA: TonB family protein [Bacteroidales bacterium]|nr:TonB family protein [Bacteroidales bacterium]
MKQGDDIKSNKKGRKKIPDFDDIIFRIRNKDYGAYKLRKKYSSTVIISLLGGVMFITAATIAPFLTEKETVDKHPQARENVEINLANLDKVDKTIPMVPPPATPAPPQNVTKQVKYVAPVVVDSISPQVSSPKLITADEARSEVKNAPVAIAEPAVKEEEKEENTEPQPFLSAEEMPVPRGGEAGLYKYIAENTRYPRVALDNNIQGKVFVRFCVTSKGTVDQVSILKGISPALNAEAIRVVKSFPPFKPGKMNGKPVPVWYIVHIDFKIQ